jgi:hypothetical protein
MSEKSLSDKFKYYSDSDIMGLSNLFDCFRGRRQRNVCYVEECNTNTCKAPTTKTSEYTSMKHVSTLKKRSSSKSLNCLTDKEFKNEYNNEYKNESLYQSFVNPVSSVDDDGEPEDYRIKLKKYSEKYAGESDGGVVILESDYAIYEDKTNRRREVKEFIEGRVAFPNFKPNQKFNLK